MLSGANEWAFGLGGPSNDLVNHADVDPAGDLYVTGSFSGSKVDFDPSDSSHTDLAAILTSGGNGTNQDIFVAKYDPTGKFLWVQHMGGSSGDNSGRGIAFFQDPATGAQSVYVTGYFYGSADFSGTSAGTPVRTSAGGADILVTKLDANTGNLLWVDTMGGTSDDLGRKVAVDRQGNAYVTGSFTGTAHFGSSLTLASAASGSTSPTSDAFVAKLDGSGNVVWAKGGGGSANDTGYGVAISQPSTGPTTVVVTGNIDDGGGTVTGQAMFGSVSLTNTNTQSGFIWDLDAASGSTNWAQEIVPTAGNSSGAWGITTDFSGNIYVTGAFTGTANFDGTTLTSYAVIPGHFDNAFVERLTPSGALTWVKALGCPDGVSDGGKVWVDDLGDVYATGYFGGLVDFNPASPGSVTFAGTPGYYNGYIWEMDPTGAFLSAWNMGGTSDVFPYAAVPYRDPVTGARALYTVGSFKGTANFPTGDTLTSAGGSDNFVLKLNRQLGTLSGTVFNDLNDNGANDEAAPLRGWTVSLSQSQNGVFVSTGLSTTTDSQGRYVFDNLVPGTYAIATAPPAGTTGYTQTAPAAGQPRVATLNAGQFTGGLDFGEYTPNQVKTYSNTTALKLLSGRTSTSTLTVADSYPIFKLNVQVNITQVSDNNLVNLILTAPDGTAVTLLWYMNNSGANFTNTTFDDAAALAIAAGSAPFTGSFRPQVLLNAFDGKNVHGTWTLSLQENATGKNVLNSWSLIVTGPGSGTAAPATSFSTTNLAVGMNSIPAVYGSDSNDRGSASAVVSQVVKPTTSSVLVTSAAPSAMPMTALAPSSPSPLLAPLALEDPGFLTSLFASKRRRSS